MFAAYQASRSPAPAPAARALAPAPSVTAAAISAAPAMSLARAMANSPFQQQQQHATLARVETTPNEKSNESQQENASQAPDLDAIADHVLERLRNELRDGRERLGYLFDDLHL